MPSGSFGAYVAAEAGVSVGTLYNYFEGGKQGILFAIFDDVFDDLRRLMQESFAPEAWHDRPFRQVFQDFAAACFAFFSEHQDLFMVLVKESQRMLFSADEDRAAYFARQQERTMNVLASAVEQAIEAGEIRALPPHSVAHVIMGNVQGIHMHRCMVDRACSSQKGDTLKTPEESAAFLTNLIFDGLKGTRSTRTTETAQRASNTTQ